MWTWEGGLVWLIGGGCIGLELVERALDGSLEIKEHLRLEGEVDGYDLGYDFDDGIVAALWHRFDII